MARARVPAPKFTSELAVSVCAVDTRVKLRCPPPTPLTVTSVGAPPQSGAREAPAQTIRPRDSVAQAPATGREKKMKMNKVLLLAAAALCGVSVAAHAADGGSSVPTAPSAEAVCSYVDLAKQKLFDMNGLKILVPTYGKMSVTGETADEATKKLLAAGVGTAEKPCTEVAVKDLTSRYGVYGR